MESIGYNYLLDKPHVVVCGEELLVLGDDASQLPSAVALVGGHQLSVGGAQRLEELRHNRACVLGKGKVLLECLGLVSMNKETNQLVLLVRFKHDVGDRSSGASDANLQKVQRSVELFERGVDAAAVIIVEQEVNCVELLVLLADDRDVRIEEGQGRGEALGDQAELGKVGVHRGERRGRWL